MLGRPSLPCDHTEIVPEPERPFGTEIVDDRLPDGVKQLRAAKGAYPVSDQLDMVSRHYVLRDGSGRAVAAFRGTHWSRVEAMRLLPLPLAPPPAPRATLSRGLAPAISSALSRPPGATNMRPAGVSIFRRSGRKSRRSICASAMPSSARGRFAIAAPAENA